MKLSYALLHSLSAIALADDIVGKVAVGYQGWFSVSKELDSNEPMNNWFHWGGNDSVPSFEIWPDVSEYENTYQWNSEDHSKLGNGQPSKLFDSCDNQTVDTHFKWMNTYGIDTAAVQRFGSVATSTDPTVVAHLELVLEQVAAAAEKHGVKFWIDYDISDWTDYATELPTDFNNNLKKYMSHPAYAKQDGKPVIGLWGIGVRPQPPSDAQTAISFLKSQGIYVIGGTQHDFYTLEDTWGPVYEMCDMLQPWNVGETGTVTDMANKQAAWQKEIDYCNSINVAYQPVVFPGFSWANLNGGQENQIPRLAGTFMWQQFVNLKNLNNSNVYVAMFDEYDEGTAIAKAATNSSMAPTDHYFLTLDADGTQLSSDFYLRVVQDGGKMLKGGALVKDCPTPHFA